MNSSPPRLVEITLDSRAVRLAVDRSPLGCRKRVDQLADAANLAGGRARSRPSGSLKPPLRSSSA
jgi:hypothetical protein